MAHPTWLSYSLAVVMVAVSVYCIGRLLLAGHLGRRNHVDVNVSHVLMGAAMAGMLVPGWNVVPDGLWEVVFGLVAIYFIGQSAHFVVRHGLAGAGDDHVHHLSHYLIHMVMAFAMLYMYWLGGPVILSPVGAMMSGPPATGAPGLTLLFIAILLASAVWQFDSITRFAPAGSMALSSSGGGAVGHQGGPSPDPDGRPWLAPRLEVACHIAMCVTMGYLLVLMV